MQKQIEEKYTDYQKKESMMNDAAKRTAQQEIQEIQLRAREYAQARDQDLARQLASANSNLEQQWIYTGVRLALAGSMAPVYSLNRRKPNFSGV